MAVKDFKELEKKLQSKKYNVSEAKKEEEEEGWLASIGMEWLDDEV